MAEGRECLALHLWANTETPLFEKEAASLRKGRNERSSLPVCRGLLGRKAHQEHRVALARVALLTQAGPRTVIARVVLCGHILGGVFNRGSLSVRAVTATEGRVTGTSVLPYEILVFSLTASWEQGHGLYRMFSMSR